MKDNLDALIERVNEMEIRYEELTRIIGQLDEIVSDYADLAPELDILREYQASGQWQADFEADEAGLVPADISRGVLSEDALYDLLQGADEVVSRARELLK